MAKQVVKIIKLQIPAGKANPAPPIGPALGGAGVNIMAFCKQFNAMTQSLAGNIIPVVISVYKDKTFDLELKQPPAADMLKKAAKIEKGSPVPNRDKVGKITKAQVLEIAKNKMQDMNARNIESAAISISGTARSMGLEVVN